MKRAAGELIVIDGLPNLRDIGGWPVSDGSHVRRGALYRSVELNRLSDVGVAASPRRCARRAHRVRPAHGDGAGGAAGPTSRGHRSRGGRRARRRPDGRAEQLLAESYRDIVGSDSALAAYRHLYTALADPEVRPALIHCTTGKDRTGWAAAARQGRPTHVPELENRSAVGTDRRRRACHECIARHRRRRGGAVRAPQDDRAPAQPGPRGRQAHGGSVDARRGPVRCDSWAPGSYYDPRRPEGRSGA